MRRTALFWLAAVLSWPAGAQNPVQETLKAPLDPRLPVYKASSRKLSGEIRSIGADTMETLMKYWIEDFTRIYPGMHFTMEAKSSLTGVPALIAGTADIAPMAREPLLSEQQEFEKKFSYGPLSIEVAGGAYRTPSKSPALVFFVNAANPIDKLTLAQLDAILSTARKRGYREDIRTWGQLGVAGEWANAPIDIYSVKQPNGIPHFLQLRIMEGGDFKAGIRELEVGLPVPVLDRIVQSVADDRFGIGYAALANEKPNTKVVALAEKEGRPFYRPTFATVTERKYALARPIYICVKRAPGAHLDPKIVEFMRFVLSRQGQEDVIKEGVMLPLRADAVKRERAKLK